MINKRLFEQHKIDITKNLNIKKICKRPFDTVLIDSNGSCYACECTAWLPQSIGNLQIQTLDEIIGSTTHKHLQESILDHSYRYCNQAQCSYLQNPDRTLGNKLWKESRIKMLRLAIDDSCNLRCPSCRTGMKFVKEGATFKRRIDMADKINQWLDQQPTTRVHIGSDGDPFASLVYRHFMSNASAKHFYSILTNGLLLKDFLPRNPHIIKRLSDLGISIDGASQHTYEQLRLGGKWEQITDNLKYAADLHKKHKFIMRLHFVVQQENYFEMEDIIELGKQLEVDQVILNPIQDWNVNSNFDKQNIRNSNHVLNGNYRWCLDRVKEIIKTSPSRFIQCPNLF